MPSSPRIPAALALSLLALTLPACGDESDDTGDSQQNGRPAMDFDITGRWEGTLHQLGLGSFEVVAEIRSLEDAEENTVSYTVIDCSGNWEYRSVENRAFRFRELIDEGAGGECKGEGTVTLTPAGEEELDYSFSGEGIESRGTLERTPG